MTSIESWCRAGLLGAACCGAGVSRTAFAAEASAATAREAMVARVAPGPAGSREVAIDLSAAHALIREFSVDSPFAVADAALARALGGVDSLEPAHSGQTLRRYADGLSDVVAVRAARVRRSEARIDVAGHVALVHPGTGAAELPAGTELLVVDLRDLPTAAELDEMLSSAVRPAIVGEVARPSRLSRVHQGPVDEISTPLNAYSTSLGFAQYPAIVGSGSRDLPIVLLVGPRIGPEAASFAATLRSAGRAWIAGDGVPLWIAESTWQGVGEDGLMVRTSILQTLEPEPTITSGGHSVVHGESWFQDIDVTPDRNLGVSLLGADGDDLDLYLLRDADGDGVFDLNGEVVLGSTSATAREHIEVVGATSPPGRYRLLVQGYFVAGASAPFTLELEPATRVPLPDVIPADLDDRSDRPGDYARLLPRLRGLPPALTGSAVRSTPALINPFGFVHPAAEGRGELRADLIIAHGMLRLFYPYFDDVGDRIDERLLETLGAADRYSGSDRLAAWRILRRFGEALDDGHQFVSSSVPLEEGRLPIFLEHAGDRAIVRRSLVRDVLPGDTLIALDGRPIEEAYAEELARTSAATLGYKLDIADRYLFAASEPLSLTLEDTEGRQRIVSAEPQSFETYLAAVEAEESGRPSGPLTDLQAPDLYYLNLNTFSTPTQEEALRAIAEAGALGSQGMVLDMRGYPGGVDHYDVAAHLIRGAFDSPRFGISYYTGPGPSSVGFSQYPIESIDAPAFEGPIVLVTGPHAVSAAENFMQMLVGAHRVLAVVGRASAGTNGNITYLSLPGGFFFSYTGMEVRNPDGSRFHGIGIQPDHEVPILATDLRDGIDRALLESIRLLRERREPPQ